MSPKQPPPSKKSSKTQRQGLTKRQVRALNQIVDMALDARDQRLDLTTGKQNAKKGLSPKAKTAILQIAKVAKRKAIESLKKNRK